MITFFSKLPDELILNIINRLPASDAFTLLLVSKEMSEFVSDDDVWKKFGAENFNDFVTRMKNLPENFRRFVLKQQFNLQVAEDIVRIQGLPRDQRQKILITPERAAAMRNANYLDHLLSDRGVLALRKGLITPKQAAVMRDENYLDHWLSVRLESNPAEQSSSSAFTHSKKL